MYIVIELQTNGSGQVANLVTTYEDKNEAESKFHQILSAASVSNVPVHSAVILTETGMMERQECYIHKEATNEG